MTSEALSALYDELADEYTQRFPLSRDQHVKAKSVMVDGGQHTLRLFAPFPTHIRAASGAYVYDLDGNQVLDFWQGHYANILGHNPAPVTQAIGRSLEEGYGLQTGMVDELANELAVLICQQTGAERVRFTTSGSLATMYAIMLARSFTGRDLVLKVGGGWHGAEPWGLVGVSYGAGGFHSVESEGLPRGTATEVVVTRFNDEGALQQAFRQHGDQIACFIIEPIIGGSGGFIPASPGYLTLARELTEQHGALLILDEVIAGFRYRAGNVGQLYGIQPDLSTFGKIVGGGMPVAAVAGRKEVMTLAGREGGRRVRFDGGTYSAHPASMLAGKVMLSYLIEHEEEVYSRLADLGQQTRTSIERIFADHGILVKCTGYPNQAVTGSSLGSVHFLAKPDVVVDSPETANDPAFCIPEVREQILKLAMLLEDVYTTHGLGALSTAHTEEDLSRFYDACDRVAQRLKGRIP